MKPKDSRNIRDRIFGFYVVNEMAELLREIIKTLGSTVDQLAMSINSTRESYNTSKAEYDEMKGKIEEDSKNKLAELEGEKQKVEEALKKAQSQETGFSNLLSLLEKRLEEITSDLLNEKLTIKEKEYRDKEKEYNDIRDGIASVGKAITELSNESKLLEISDRIMRINSLTKELGPLKESADAAEKEKEKAEKKLEDADSALKAAVEDIERKGQLEELKVLLAELDGTQKKYSQILINLGKLDGEQEKIDKKVEEAKIRKAELQTEASLLKRKIDLYANDVCPECDNDLTTTSQLEKKQQYEDDLNAKLASIDTIGKNLSKADELTSQISGKRSEITNNRTSCGAELKSISSKISALDSISGITDAIEVDYSQDHINPVDCSAQMEAVQEAIHAIDLKNEEELKKKVEKAKEEETKKKEKLKLAEAEVSSKEGSIKELKTGIKQDDVDKIKSTKFKHKSQKDYEKAIEDKKSLSEEDQERLDKASKDMSSLNAEIELLKKDIKGDEYFTEYRKSMPTLMKFLKSSMDKLSGIEDISDVEDGILEKVKEKIKEKVEASRSECDKQSKEANRIEAAIEAINETSSESSLESLQNVMGKFSAKIEEEEKALNAHYDELNFHKVAGILLSDEGIKAYILSDIVPAINNEISNVLSMFGINLTVLFNDEFKPEIFRFGKPAKLKSISTGQRKMVDAAILMSITQLLVEKYNSINVVFYDEIFSSLHVKNVSIMLQVLKKIMCTKLGLNVFVINHSYMASAQFDRILEVVSVNNFSEVNKYLPEEYERRLILNT
jgi:DNA repair exonuclease SbcCD ATPase subunit